MEWHKADREKDIEDVGRKDAVEETTQMEITINPLWDSSGTDTLMHGTIVEECKKTPRTEIMMRTKETCIGGVQFASVEKDGSG